MVDRGVYCRTDLRDRKMNSEVALEGVIERCRFKLRFKLRFGH